MKVFDEPGIGGCRGSVHGAESRAAKTRSGTSSGPRGSNSDCYDGRRGEVADMVRRSSGGSCDLMHSTVWRLENSPTVLSTPAPPVLHVHGDGWRRKAAVSLHAKHRWMEEMVKLMRGLLQVVSILQQHPDRK